MRKNCSRNETGNTIVIDDEEADDSEASDDNP
jgi:hypothetical protein